MTDRFTPSRPVSGPTAPRRVRRCGSMLLAARCRPCCLAMCRTSAPPSWESPNGPAHRGAVPDFTDSGSRAGTRVPATFGGHVAARTRVRQDLSWRDMAVQEPWDRHLKSPVAAQWTREGLSAVPAPPWVLSPCQKRRGDTTNLMA